MHWFVDLDDTLVVGPITWAINTVLPRLMEKYSLASSPTALAAALREGQEKAASGSGEAELLDLFFDRLGWPAELKRELVQEVFDNYQPSLFDDSLQFLTWLSDQRQSVFILSNNDRAVKIAGMLVIAPYIQEYFTTALCAVPKGKPDRALWDYVMSNFTIASAVLVVDDPWSDGAFADVCNIPCYIVDRLNRFRDMVHYRCVTSLSDIALLDAHSDQPEH